ncbi:MAG: transketolase, partial [Thermodesulfobacteriota bacterium]
AFGWEVENLPDGHDLPSILAALVKAKQTKGKPFAIIANTIKGKGVSIFENKGNYHGVAPNDEELKVALIELGEAA